MIKKIAQELAKKLKNYEEFAAEKTDRARQLRIDELSVQQERNPTTVPCQMQENFTDLETASSSGASHVPSQPFIILSPIGMPSRDSGLPLETLNSMGTSGNVFESLLAREGPSSALFENSRNLASSFRGLKHDITGNRTEHGRGVRRDPQSSSIPSPRFNQGIGTLSPLYKNWRNSFSQWYDGLPEISDLGNASWKIPRLYGIPKLECQLQD